MKKFGFVKGSVFGGAGDVLFLLVLLQAFWVYWLSCVDVVCGGLLTILKTDNIEIVWFLLSKPKN